MKILSNIPLLVSEPYSNRSFIDYLPELENKIQKSHGLKYVSLKNVLDKIPDSEYPDVFVMESPEYLPVPEDLEIFMGIKILLITDWNVCTRFLEQLCPLFDYCFVDYAGAKLLKSWGLNNVHHKPLFGHNPDIYKLLNGHQSKQEFLDRPYDVSFCGSLNSGLHFERNQILYELSELHENINVYIGNCYDQEYVEILNQSKIVWNYAIRKEANMRIFESMACGALPLVESSNEEVPTLFEAYKHYVPYYNGQLEILLTSLTMDPDKMYQIHLNVVGEIEKHTKKNQILNLLKFVQEDKLKHQLSSPIKLSEKPQMLPNLVKIDVLGLGYHGDQVLNALSEHFPQIPELESETVPGILLQFAKDSIEKDSPSEKIEQFFLEKVIHQVSLNFCLKEFFLTQFYFWKKEWVRVLNFGSQFLKKVQILTENPNQLEDRKNIYRYLIPPLRLGEAMTNDLNRCYEKDRINGDYFLICELLKDHILSSCINASLEMDDVETSIHYVKKMSRNNFMSTPRYLQEAKIYPRIKDFGRSAIAFNDLFTQEPLNLDHWSIILDGCSELEKWELWRYYYNEFNQLVKRVYHQNKELVKSFQKMGNSNSLSNT